VGWDVVEARGGRLVLVPFLSGHSTSAIVERIKRGVGCG
jgi:bifunctional ADP-heptose synthase (sugar kinase/adenylyltransferase)